MRAARRDYGAILLVVSVLGTLAGVHLSSSAILALSIIGFCIGLVLIIRAANRPPDPLEVS